MANKKTKAITAEEYKALIEIIRSGIPNAYTRPNPKVAMALVCVANLGLRIGDVVRLKPSNFKLRSDGKITLQIKEEKTNKERNTPVAQRFYIQLMDYFMANHISENSYIFSGMRGQHLSVRDVQIILARAVSYLGYGDDISTHSFRKLFATTLYQQKKDIVLTQTVLNHSSPAVTRRYIGIAPEQIEEALEAISY